MMTTILFAIFVWFTGSLITGIFLYPFIFACEGKLCPNALMSIFLCPCVGIVGTCIILKDSFDGPKVLW